MSVIPIDWDSVRSAVDRATVDVAGLLRNVPNGSAPVPGLEWNIGEVGAHLVTTARGFMGFAHGEPSSMDGRTIAQINVERLNEYAPRAPVEIADDLARDSEAFIAAITKDDSLMTMGGDPIDRSMAAATWLGELRLHELDISRAVGRGWSLSRAEALLVTYSGLSQAPRFVDPEATRGVHATFEVRLRGGETVSMSFDDATLVVTRGPTPSADCRMSADPVASLLIGYGRVSQWRVGLTGKIVVWGRRPWLALRFNKLLTRV